MGPNGDDNDSHGSGPPPDPTMRSWRHPSEIAAAAAAASRPVRPESSGLGRVAAYVLGTTLAGAAMFGVALVAIGATVTLHADGPASPALAQQQLPPENLTAAAPPEVTTTSTTGTSAASVVPQSGVSSSGGTVPGSSYGVTGTSSTLTTTSGTAETALDLSLLPPAEQFGDGVFAVSGDEVRRVGGYVAVDGMVATSASALGDPGRVALVGDGTWVPATVVLIDPLSDVAMIELGGDGAEAFLSAVEYTDVASVSNPDGQGQGPLVEIPDSGPDHGTITGILVGTDRRNLTNSGIALYDLLLTTAKRPDGGSGAGLLDTDGTLIGMVVDSVGHLAAAVPIERVLAIAKTATEWQMPSLTWLGIRGESSSGGGVDVETVLPGSPAEEAGIAPGDVIAGLGGTDVIDWYHLVHLVRQEGTGSEVVLEIERGSGQDRSIIEATATIGSRLEAP